MSRSASCIQIRVSGSDNGNICVEMVDEWDRPRIRWWPIGTGSRKTWDQIGKQEPDHEGPFKLSKWAQISLSNWCGARSKVLDRSNEREGGCWRCMVGSGTYVRRLATANGKTIGFLTKV